MDEGIGQQLLIILGLVLANGFFSMTEMAIVSARRARLESRAEEGDKRAQAALALSDHPTNMLSTVQIGITLISTVTGLYGGTAMAVPVARMIKTYVPSLAPYADAVSPFLIVTLITYLSLVIGELVPKRIALNSPEGIALSVARPMTFFSYVTKPLVAFLTVSTVGILKIFGIRHKEEEPVTEDEIKLMLNQGAAMGAFEEEEPELVDNIFRLADLDVGDVMTPRPRLDWLDLDGTEEDMRQAIMHAQHFRLLVGRDSLDELLGLVHVSDIFRRSLETNNTVPLKSLIASCVKEPMVVPETISLVKLLGRFRTEGVHEAVVLDEFGGVSGFVTLHDVMEEIVGLMPSTEEERQEEENRILPRTEHSWYVDGLLSVDEWREFFEWETPLPGEEEDLYKTMGGFVTYMVGRIPHEGDHVSLPPFTFEVCDMDNTRVDKIIVTREAIPQETPDVNH